MDCVYQCPGLAIFGYNLKKDWLFLPIEYFATENQEVYLVNNNGEILGSGVIEKILLKPNKTNVARVKSIDLHGKNLINVRGFIVKSNYPEKVEFKPNNQNISSKTYVCHCEDVTFEDIMEEIGDRKFISADEVKHITRLGMGACRGKRCMKRLKQAIASKGVSIIGEPSPRGPLSNQLLMGELYPKKVHEKIITNIKINNNKKIKTNVFIAGGGIAGSALFRYLSEAKLKPVMINFGRGASWRNIAGGRPTFTVPEISDIAKNNLQIFKDLQTIKNIDYKPIRYVTFAHDENTYKALDASRAWSNATMINTKDFKNEISPYFNTNIKTYTSALITNDCWQATPGKVIDLIRKIGLEKGGTILEDTKLISVEKIGNKFNIIIRNHDKTYSEYEADHFINALGPDAEKYAAHLDIETGLFPVRHQAFITRPLPMLGHNNNCLDMLIDRRKYKGFSAVYGQQLKETGQIIGCASPANDATDTDKNLKLNTKEFIEIVSEIFVDWIPNLSSVGFQAVWSGYYVEPRYIIDPELGLFIGLRGHGFMLAQYLAKLYADKYTGKIVPNYFERLKLSGDGLPETAFK